MIINKVNQPDLPSDHSNQDKPNPDMKPLDQENPPSLVLTADHLPKKTLILPTRVKISSQDGIEDHRAPVKTLSVREKPLLDPTDLKNFRKQWDEIQVRFVDKPLESVRQADLLMTEALEKHNQMVKMVHDSLKSKYDPKNIMSTEDMRKALLEYRSFISHLAL